MICKEEKAFRARIRAMGKLTKDQRNAVVCGILGHSRIQTHCFGYFYCGRCDAQVGDSIGSTYNAKHIVIVGHACETCKKNYADTTWKDRLYVEHPSPKEEKG